MLEFAKKLAKESGRILMKNLDQNKKQRQKSNFNPVTPIDILVENYIIDCIKKKFPTHNIISEETGLIDNDSIYTWIIDPLDGTINYIHKYPHFCTSIALFKENSPFLGVVYNPNLDELFYSQINKGAFLNNEKIKVSDVRTLEEAHLATGFSYKRGKDFDNSIEKFKKVLYSSQAVRRDGAAALDLCYVACGRYDGFWVYGLQIWDIAAGIIIVEEAGGKSDFIKTLKTYKQYIISANEYIYTNLKNVLDQKD